MSPRLVVPDHPDETDREAALAPLRAFNIERAGDPRARPVAVTLVDADGRKVGGLWGRIAYDWMFVEYLTTPESQRRAGLGSALMAEAERIAREDGCIGIWIDTYDFQARGFYERLGFEVFGTLEDHPFGHRRFLLRKRLKTRVDADTVAGRDGKDAQSA